jgi:hypothetical protein
MPIDIGRSTLKKYTIVVGIFCMVACLAAVAVYLFGFANKPLSSESLFWAMPIVSPIAFVIYLKSKTVGSVFQTVLYSFAVYGAFQMIREACIKGGECYTHNAAAVAVASMFAGVHVIAMLIATILMCAGVARAFRSPLST